MPSPDPLPHSTELFYIDAFRHPLKLKCGEDEILFLLKNLRGRFRTFVDGMDTRPLDTPTCVEVRPSPFHGLGVFTTKDCLPGDLLFSERPMVSTLASCITVKRTDMQTRISACGRSRRTPNVESLE
jgi:hypothetical protein